MKKVVLILLVGLVSLTACKKYDEGPLISFRSKEKRLCQKWNLYELYLNSNLSEISTTEVEFTKDGKYHYISYSKYDTTYDNLSWQWENNKKNIKVFGTRYTYEISHFDTTTQQYIFDTIPYNYSGVLKINKLTNDELWYEIPDSVFVNEPTTFLYKYKIQ